MTKEQAEKHLSEVIWKSVDLNSDRIAATCESALESFNAGDGVSGLENLAKECVFTGAYLGAMAMVQALAASGLILLDDYPQNAPEI